jgi:hypothetical protein
MEGGVLEIVFDMPEADARVGTCGLRDDDYNPCRKKGVIRVEVEVREYDMYEEAREFRPYTGETVMVAMCADHKAKMETAYIASKQYYQDLANKREEKAAEVERLRAQLETAEYELNHL